MGRPARKHLIAAFAASIATVGATATTAEASHGTNGFSGNWSTNIGSVSFNAVSNASGAQELEALGGVTCDTPTTYYHGEYSDNSGSGTMAACTSGSNESLEGRYRNDNATLTFPGGDFAISLTSPTGFSGFYTADDPEFPGQFSYTGTFVSHFPTDGCCDEPPPDGGDGSLDPPTQMCGEAEDAGHRAIERRVACVTRDFLEFDAKGQARSQLRKDLKLTMWLCGMYATAAKAGLYGRLPDADYDDDTNAAYGPLAPAYQALCYASIELMGATLAVVNDPPDPNYRRIALPRARSAAKRRGGCSPRALCKSLNSHRKKVDDAGFTAHSLALTANRFSAAVQDDAIAEAFLQGAVGKVWAGELAADVAAQERAGRKLAKQHKREGLGLTFDRRGVKVLASDIARKFATKKMLKRLISTGLADNTSQARKVLKTALEKVKGSVDTKDLATSLPVSGFAAQHRSIAMSELAAIVSAYAAGGEISSSTRNTLIGDLEAAQAACNDAEDRRAAIAQFVSHARGAAARGVANFLALGAKPLKAGTLPAASCT